ncbi:MAG: bifunctional proline dehydrogenase/L-glutamate gamma-semialdehyde dehydrogenase PutA [Hyphomonadaceae bacterium]|nr:bifunctional proline dehydrogenase/L-glutamate gamma-semialdehyde dehydrogenase PutA [Hyphomonadaceae bacterium]
MPVSTLGAPAVDWDNLDAAKYPDENREIAALLEAQPLDVAARAGAAAEARALVVKARALKRRKGVMESFLEEFGLSNAEGLALMCLAEALLRVPDEETADKLIAEKISTGRWEEHLGRSDHWLVNAGTWGLMLTGRIVAAPDEMASDAESFMRRFVARAGEPVVRAGAMQAMRILGEQFVLGRTIEAALRRGKGFVREGAASSFSFDMLGEGARTAADAARYTKLYAEAIDAVGRDAEGAGPVLGNGVSVKLSALFPRYEARQEARVMAELLPRTLELCERAKAHGIGLTLDAEEADRLALSLKLLDALCAAPSLGGWDGLGLALQAYQKRARLVVDAVATLARRRKRRLMVRLVKGAYWDGEIKRAQVMGRSDFPVFTTKAATDVSYLACAKAMLAAPDAIYPQFATHNAHTVAAVRRMAEAAGVSDYEFQRLHGMGEALYAALQASLGPVARVRVYAPVGGHEDLLPYLVRRLLENGANTSFVHSFLDDDVSPDLVAADPITKVEASPHRHPRVPAPPALYGASRRNSTGRDLSIASDRAAFVQAVADLDREAIETGPLIGAPARESVLKRKRLEMRAPADPERIVGIVAETVTAQAEAAVATALAAQKAWNDWGGVARAAVLRAMGDALQANADRLVALIAREGGRTLQDGVDEVREAVDFCRYYAAEAERLFGGETPLPSPAGETNALELMGRGVFVCISPWNFPLAIFTGQIAAALAAGNTVVAKPAEQTPLIAHEAVQLFRAAGLPEDVLALCPGAGDVGAALVADPRIAGVCFTGSTEVAQAINRSLAAREGPIPVLIAETGGLNGMFVDTTALAEQVVDDAVLSAFGSAGQRCSGLRVLFLPNATADHIIRMLTGAMQELKIGDPADPATDIGPVIDADAKAALDAHMERMRHVAKVHAQCDVGRLPALGLAGTFFGPAIVELPSLDLIAREVFGPVLHVVRYDPAEIAAVGGALAAKGYGLTLGVHSRLESFAAAVKAAVPAGNLYVNRSMIGAVVGVQPFGGLGLSGTGPKAGGPHYVARFAAERTVSVNIAAQGGDPALFNL